MSKIDPIETSKVHITVKSSPMARSLEQNQTVNSNNSFNKNLQLC